MPRGLLGCDSLVPRFGDQGVNFVAISIGETFEGPGRETVIAPWCFDTSVL
jgi:hypothetical protein